MTGQPDAAALLGAVADALNACEAAGVAVKLKNGAVMTRWGYVLPLGDGRWGARTLAYSLFSAADDADEMDE